MTQPVPNRRKNRIKPVSQTLIEEMQAIEVECHQRMTKIRQNMHMKDVAQLKEVPLSETLRPHVLEIRSLHQLDAAAEQRKREILDGHIAEMRRMRDVNALQQLRSHLLHREWSFLKGVYPVLYREAESESEKMLVRLEYESDSRRRSRR